jgi:hypothetical protein
MRKNILLIVILIIGMTLMLMCSGRYAKTFEHSGIHLDEIIEIMFYDETVFLHYYQIYSIGIYQNHLTITCHDNCFFALGVEVGEPVIALYGIEAERCSYFSLQNKEKTKQATLEIRTPKGISIENVTCVE